MAYEDLAREYELGDILYGLDAPRAEALNAILEHLGIDRKVRSTKYLLGCIPLGQTEQAVVLIQNDLTNSVWDSNSPGRYKSDKSIRKEFHSRSDRSRGIEFKAFLDGHEKYDVKQRDAPGIQAALQTGQNPMPLMRQAWQRTSKAGLEFQLSRRDGKIHFVVSDIFDKTNTRNLPGVATALTPLGELTNKVGHGTSITSGELRWMFRHRHLHSVRQRVRFWLPDGAVTHEDFFGRAEWNDYQPKNIYNDSKTLFKTILDP